MALLGTHIKQCRDCLRILHLVSSSPSKKNADGVASYCKDCTNIRHEGYRRAKAAKLGKVVTPHKPKGPGLKWCSGCKIEQRTSAFASNRSRSDGLSAYCVPCHNAKSDEHLERGGGARNYHLVYRYGITALQYDEMFAKQCGLCDLCRERKAEHVDHCHATRTVRALLCFNCNQGLGNFRDNETTMLAAAKHVVRHRGGQGQPVELDPNAAARFRALFGTAA